MKYLPYGPQFYDEDTITDQPERQIVAEIIREKALHSLNEEIPQGIAVAIDQMKMNQKVCHIDATIICERDSHKGIIIGKQGSMLKKIGSTANAFQGLHLVFPVSKIFHHIMGKEWRKQEVRQRTGYGTHRYLPISVLPSRQLNSPEKQLPAEVRFLLFSFCPNPLSLALDTKIPLLPAFILVYFGCYICCRIKHKKQKTNDSCIQISRKESVFYLFLPQ